MPEWPIRPFEGIGQIDFGMARSKVRELLGSEFTTIRNRHRDVDVYDELGVYCYFDSDGTVKFVEAFDASNANYDGLYFFVSKLPAIIERLAAAGQPATVDGTECYFKGIGVSLDAPRDGRVESVGVFRKDAAERHLQLLQQIAEKDRQRAEARKLKGPFENPFKREE